MHMGRTPFTLHNALTQWQSGPFALGVLAAVVLVGYWYLRADWKLASRGRRWPAARTAAFLLGLAAVDLALQSPVATFAIGRSGAVDAALAAAALLALNDPAIAAAVEEWRKSQTANVAERPVST